MDNVITKKQGWRRMMALMAVAFLLAACSGGHHAPPPTPVITTQPVDVSVVAGDSASFSVAATGTTPSYQWQSSDDHGTSWTNISGATSTSYTIATAALGDSGRLFRVLVTAAGATVASSSAQLTVTSTVQAPAITVQPGNQTVTEPATATFNVTATGTSLQYQWQLSTDSGSSWADIGSATAPSYTTPATSASATGAQFRVQVSNSAGSVTSNTAVLTINPASPGNTAPSFATQPASQSVAVGNSATFSASVSGTPAPTLQWQRSNNSGGSWADIAGANSDHYSTPVTVAGDNGAQFRLVATNSAGSVTSNTATLTVTVGNTAPVFTTQPQDVSVREGNAATFSAVASGVPSPTYQWQVSNNSGSSWDNMNGATDASYTQPGNLNTCAATGKQFRVVASNSEGTVTSNAVTLTVNPQSTGWQCDQLINSGSSNTFSVASNASGQVAVLWPGYVDGVPGLYIRRYDPIQGWAAAEGKALPDSGAGGMMSAGMDNQGVVTAVWAAADVPHGGWVRVWAARHLPASGWGAVAMQPVPDYTADGPGNGQPLSGGVIGLAVNPAGGDASVLWTQDQLVPYYASTGKRNLLAATFGAGGWGALNILYAQNATDGETYVPGDLRVAVGPNGHAVAVWERQSYSNTYSLWSFHFMAGSSSASPLAIAATPNSTNFGNAALAVDGNGHALFAWENYDSSASTNRVRLSRYDGSWETPHWMSSTSTEVTRHPAVTFAPNGNALVTSAVYASNASSVDYRVVALPWTTSGGWGALEPVFDTGSNIQPGLDVALEDSGVAMIVAADGSSRLKSSRRLSGSWAAPEIGNKTYPASIMGRLIRLPSGDLLAVCLGYGYSTNYLWANSYKPAP